MFVARLDAILSRTMGLRPGVRPPAVILDAARATAFELDLPFDDLPERAAVSEHVRQALVAHLRPKPGRLLDPAVTFRQVVEFVAGRLATSQRTQRILVLGCGDGADVWSCAVALAESGIDPSWFEIDAVDQSEVAVRRARTGLFGAHAFARMTEDCRRRWFRPQADGERVDVSLRHRARFQVADPRDSNTFRGRPRHDVVLSRYLLGDSEPASRRALWARIQARLIDDGLLVLGAEDGVPDPRTGFEAAAGGRGASVYRRADSRLDPPSHDDPVPGGGRSRGDVESPGVGPSEVQRLVVSGLMAVRAGDHAKADQLFHRAIGLDPHCRTSIEMLVRAAGGRIDLRRR